MDYYFMTTSKTYLWQWKRTHLISSCLTFPLSMKSITICYNWREHGIQPIHHPKAKEEPSHVKNPHLNLGIFFDHLNCTYCNIGLLKAGSFLVLLQTEAIITNFFHFFHFLKSLYLFTKSKNYWRVNITREQNYWRVNITREQKSWESKHHKGAKIMGE